MYVNIGNTSDNKIKKINFNSNFVGPLVMKHLVTGDLQTGIYFVIQSKLQMTSTDGTLRDVTFLLKIPTWDYFPPGVNNDITNVFLHTAPVSVDQLENTYSNQIILFVNLEPNLWTKFQDAVNPTTPFGTAPTVSK